MALQEGAIFLRAVPCHILLFLCLRIFTWPIPKLLLLRLGAVGSEADVGLARGREVLFARRSLVRGPQKRLRDALAILQRHGVLRDKEKLLVLRIRKCVHGEPPHSANQLAPTGLYRRDEFRLAPDLLQLLLPAVNVGVALLQHLRRGFERMDVQIRAFLRTILEVLLPDLLLVERCSLRAHDQVRNLFLFSFPPTWLRPESGLHEVAVLAHRFSQVL
mmetsp:Transcript_17026/g.42192  ORF Transcript_17026/g.42192 Transcript_17026/m.42192 type:complete len:218 (-) Transcript_17026:97-750(-)